MRKKNKILSGVMALGIGAFISKLLGAIYRVPLTNLIGGKGLGLYQMIFPVYAVLLDFSGAGVPSALSKVISSYQKEDKYLNAENYLKSSIKLFAIVGFLGSALMCLLALPFSTFQGDRQAFLGYLAIAPAVLLVSLISCYRGYFQGLMNMNPTAVSQILEQVIKLILGLILAYLLKNSLPLAVAGATLAITFSELGALIFLYAKHKRLRNTLLPRYLFDKENHKERVKKVIKITLPITLIGIMIPLSQVVDSFLVVNLLKGYREDAVSLYGLMSGVASTVIGLPVAVCYGISAVTIPTISASKTEKERKDNAVKTILLTVAVAIPCSLVCLIFSPFIINLLFRNLPITEKAVSVNLLKTLSPCVVLLSLLQTTNAVLIGKGKYYHSVASLGAGIIVKMIVSLVLLKIPSVNIYGSAIGVIACYFTVCLVNLFMIFNFKVKSESKTACRREYAN
jgi:stage V sporulation protein B